MKLSIKKAYLVILSLFITTLPLKTEAFDLADYQTSLTNAKDTHQAAMADLAAKEAQYKVAYNARLNKDKSDLQAAKLAETDPDKQLAIQDQIDELVEMRAKSNACGLY